MWDFILELARSWFVYPGLSWNQALIAIALAFAFGAAWFAAYWTPILRKPWAWAILAGSAFLTMAAFCFVQIPLRWWSNQALSHFWSQDVLTDWLLLSGIPAILLSGLVQEGSKLVPVIIYWWRKGRSLDPKVGLIIGAVAGLGFGVFEAVYAHNLIFTYGWNWGLVQTSGVVALAGFWERFFAVGFHIAASALAGYGLAKGWGWQFYLIASGLHALLNYGALLFQAGVLTTVPVEIYAAVLAALITAGALWLRWKRLAEPTVELRL
jgi:RsiW-degrading membrane proteinase PrsW (M82 family)